MRTAAAIEDSRACASPAHRLIGSSRQWSFSRPHNAPSIAPFSSPSNRNRLANLSRSRRHPWGLRIFGGYFSLAFLSVAKYTRKRSEIESDRAREPRPSAVGHQLRGFCILLTTCVVGEATAHRRQMPGRSIALLSERQPSRMRHSNVA